MCHFTMLAFFESFLKFRSLTKHKNENELILNRGVYRYVALNTVQCTYIFILTRLTRTLYAVLVSDSYIGCSYEIFSFFVTVK